MSASLTPAQHVVLAQYPDATFPALAPMPAGRLDTVDGVTPSVEAMVARYRNFRTTVIPAEEAAAPVAAPATLASGAVHAVVHGRTRTFVVEQGVIVAESG